MFKSNKMKKLSLNRETLRALSGAEMNGVLGGRAGDHGGSCSCNATYCGCVTGSCPKAMVGNFGGVIGGRL